MPKGGRAKKKLALPPSGAAQGKRVGDIRSLLPGASASDDRVCWRFTHVDHDGPWGFDSMDSVRARWEAALGAKGRLSA
ncbi:hypothetical protein ACIP6I_07695 [Streptomyces anulatus]